MPEIQVRSKDHSKKKRSKKGLLYSMAAISLLAALSWLLLLQDTAPKAVVSQYEAADEAINIDENQPTTGSIKPRSLKNFSGKEFVDLYNTFAYPNVRQFEILPVITGNNAADERIRTIAIQRGYIARSVAIPPLADVGSYQLQERALSDWENLTDAATKDGHKLTLTAAFRTIENQRTLFNDALSTLGATPSSIASGSSDAAVNSVLRQIAIPGYTRHHSGFAVDIGCDSDPGVVFGASSCYRWLSANNYKNAKTHGWIPSYPAAAPNQGPDPEEWEYSWVGFEVLSESVD